MKKIICLIVISHILLVFSCSNQISDELLTEEGSEQIEVMPSDDSFNAPFPPGFISKSGTKNKDMERSITKSLPSSKTIPVPRFAQETSYWCGPASAQMIQYYFDMPASQSYIAQRCDTSPSIGTYVYKLVNWFNDSPMTGYKDLPSWWKWEYIYLSSYTDFKDKIRSSVGSYNAPQIWHLKTYPSSTYHLPGYTFNSGHYVTGSGYNYNSTPLVFYDDPWYGSGGGSNKWISAYTMYRCIIANAKIIIW